MRKITILIEDSLSEPPVFVHYMHLCSFDVSRFSCLTFALSHLSPHLYYPHLSFYTFVIFTEAISSVIHHQNCSINFSAKIICKV